MTTRERKRLRRILAANLRRERQMRKWSQETLAERAALSQVYISKLETAKAAASLDTIEALARAFGREPSELLHERSSA